MEHVRAGLFDRKPGITLQFPSVPSQIIGVEERLQSTAPPCRAAVGRHTGREVVIAIDLAASGKLARVRPHDTTVDFGQFALGGLGERQDLDLAAIGNQCGKSRLNVGVNKLQRLAGSVLEVDEPIPARQVQKAKPQFLQRFEKWPSGPCIFGHGFALGCESACVWGIPLSEGNAQDIQGLIC